MFRFLHGAAVAALTLAAACGAAASAEAQTYDRLVVFGDSLSDNGNLYLASGRTQPPSPPYFQGRFSTGPVFTELLGFNAANFNGAVTGSINLAFGGSRTDASTTPPPGLLAQLAGYVARGGRFGAGDLVSVLGGANDIFQGQSPVTAAANVNSLVAQVTQAGAGTVLITNLPRLSTTPQFRPTPALAQQADVAATTFNSSLAANLAATATARPNSNIILVDLFAAADLIASSPGVFGVANVTDACITTTSVCADPSGYFYTDGVHPTALGHRLIAALANDYLHYGDIGAQSALQGETSFRHREETLDAASEALSGRAPWEQGARVSVAIVGDSVDADARGSVTDSSSEGWGARIAAESSLNPNMRLGLAGSYRNSNVDSARLNFNAESFGVDLYGGWRADSGLFVNAAAGAAWDRFDDIRRLTTLAPVVHDSETSGTSAGARIQAGTWFDMGGVALSPRAALAWTSSEVDGYVEQGPAAQYAYEDRRVEALTGEVALRAEAEFGGFGLFAEGGYRDVLDDGSDAVRIGLFNNTAQVLEREVEEPFGAQALASAGIEGRWGPVEVTVAYRGRFGDHAESHMGGVQFKLPL